MLTYDTRDKNSVITPSSPSLHHTDPDEARPGPDDKPPGPGNVPPGPSQTFATQLLTQPEGALTCPGWEDAATAYTPLRSLRQSAGK